MSKQTINVGVRAGDKSGDPLRTAFSKVNENFTELYALTGGSSAALIELAQDYAAPLFNHASHTNITVTYDDANNKILLTGSPAQVQTDWNAVSGLAVVLNKPALFSGSYTDLTNKPTIPSAYTLPTASATVLGGIKIGTGLSIDVNGVVTASADAGSTLVNGARTVSLGSDGVLTLPAQSATLTNVNQIVSAKIYRAGASTDTATIQTALDNWMGSEQAWIDIRTEDAVANAVRGARPWAGMPSYTAYPLVVGYQPTGGQLPPSANMSPTAKTASDNYLAYKELQRNIDIVAGNNTFSFENTGALRVPGVITKNNNLTLVSVGTTVYQGLSDQGLPVEVRNDLTASVVADGENGRVFIRTDDGTTLRTWQFDVNGGLTLPGDLTLPLGSEISETATSTVISPPGAGAGQSLVIYPTAGVPEGDHIHLTADGGTTDLYLGSDNQYVKIDHGGKIVVGVTNGIPNGVSNWVGQGGWNQGYYSAIATTGGTGTGLTVNVAAGGGGYIGIGQITIANPGSGYTAGDIITINNENNLPGTFTISVTQIPLTWRYGVTGAFTLPNEAVIGQASDVEITVAATAYTDSLTAWESVRASYQAQANNLGVTSAGWPFIAWSATGPTAAGLIAQLLTAYQIQQSPSSPPTPLIFQPPITTSAYNELRSALIVVRDSYATWQALLTSVKITSGSESVTLMSNGKLIVPGIVQTDPEENLVIRTRYAVVTSPPGIGTYSNVDFTFGTNGHLNIPIGIASDTGNSRITPKSIVPNKFFNFFVDSTDVTFTRATLAMPIAENNKTVDAQFYHNNGTIGYLWNQGTDSNVTNLNNAFNMFANGTAIKLTTQDSGQFTWTFAKDGTLTVPGSIIGTATQNVFNTTSTTVNAFGAATTLNMGAAGGTTTIAGDLVVNGTTTTINSTTVTVDDKNIELGSVASPTNTTADGGGITLKGTTDKTIVWDNANTNWTASEHWNIASGKKYKINNVDVLTATSVLNDASQTSVTIAGSATTALNIGASGAPITGFAATATTSSTASSLGYLGLPQSATNTSATLAIGDSGKHIYVNTASQTMTIPANSSVAYPIGTTLTFIAGPSATTVSIAITTDTMYLAGTGTTGTRTLAAHGMATAVKVAATTWYINGTGLT